MKVWVVTAAFENGVDVSVFESEADANAEYLRLAEEWDIHPDLGYVADYVGWKDRATDSNDLPYLLSEVFEGDRQVRINQVEVEVTKAIDLPL